MSGEIECGSGHVHKSERSADECDRKQLAKSAAKTSRRLQAMTLIDPENGEHGGAYFVARANKVSFRRRAAR